MKANSDVPYWFLLLSYALTGACAPPPAGPEPPIVVVVTDASKAPNPAETAPACEAACANLERLGCPEGQVHPGEDPCYVVCGRAEATGGRVDFKPGCIAAAKDKAALLACKTYRCM